MIEKNGHLALMFAGGVAAGDRGRDVKERAAGSPSGRGAGRAESARSRGRRSAAQGIRTLENNADCSGITLKD